MNDRVRALLDAAKAQITAWQARALKAEETAAQWEKLWRDDINTAKQAIAERDEALAELDRLRSTR